MITKLKERILAGGAVSRKEALRLACEADLEPLCRAADDIRRQMCGNRFDLCAIINGKCGHCSEDCKYCAQSARYPAEVESYPLLGAEPIARRARSDCERGVLRFSVVTSGRTLTEGETDAACEAYREIGARCGIARCASHGLLDYGQLVRLREAGVTRYHCNLETSRRNFPNICTTHTYDEKCAVIRNARRAGLEVCSGGIIGMGETMEDRVDLAIELRELGVRSVPVNLLNPIRGTPFEDRPVLPPEELLRTVAVFRFLLPGAALRLAGGRGLLPDRGRAAFCSGANAAITGDMLTTAGVTVETDLALVRGLGYEVARL